MLVALANVIVLSQHWHANLCLLFLAFKPDVEMDDSIGLGWNDLLSLLSRLPEGERNFLHDLLIVGAAFDGQLSALERTKLCDAFSPEEWRLYAPRLAALVEALRRGHVHRAYDLCGLDTIAG